MTRDVPSYDVVIAGGGIIGCSLLLELTRAGLSVALVERQSIGSQASRAAAGVISIPKPTSLPVERVELARMALELYPGYVEELESSIGQSVDFAVTGDLLTAITYEEIAVLQDQAHWLDSKGFSIERLSERDLDEIDPGLSSRVSEGWYVPAAARVSGARLSVALATLASRLGATIIENQAVTQVLVDRSKVQGVLASSTKITADNVVLAIGAWTSELTSYLGLDLPVRPIKGQMLSIRSFDMPQSIVHGGGGLIVPQSDGSVIVGSTTEEAGFDSRITGEGVRFLLDVAATLTPRVLRGEMLSTWTGFRPGSGDDLPIVGQVLGTEGLWIATGHGRLGIRESIPTARLFGESIVAGRVDERLESFNPTRFMDQ